MVKGLNAALDPDQAKKSYIEPASGDVNILIPFETEAHRPVKATGTSTSDLLHEADATDASGGTDIYEGLLSALDELPSESEASQYTTAIVLMTDGRSNSDHQMNSKAPISRAAVICRSSPSCSAMPIPAS